MRRATRPLHTYLSMATAFQSTLSMRRATFGFEFNFDAKSISIHALHEESDLAVGIGHCMGSTFQSTLSMRRATGYDRRRYRRNPISIHALHEESDPPLNCS